jgi:lysozyme family protein
MANFDQAFELTMKAEGGYVNDPDDPGGETYMGVARSRNPKWDGWINIDILKSKPNFPKNLDADDNLQGKVKGLYERNYWDKVQGDNIENQDIAESIFDFAVNAGPRTSSKLAQLAVEAEPDGIIGENTLVKINEQDAKTFLAVFTLAKIGRYVNIVENNKSSRKYFYGWVRRALEGM